MSYEYFEQILDFVSKDPHRVLRILGGEVIEPDLRISPYLEAAKRLSINPVLGTNGYEYSLWRSGKLDPSLFKEIIISVYGNKSCHNTITGVRDSYENVIQTLKFLSSIDRRPFALTVNTLIFPGNERSFGEFIRFIASRGVDEVKVLTLSPLGRCGNWADDVYGNYAIPSRTRERILQNITKDIRKGVLGDMRIVWERLKGVSVCPGVPLCRLEKESMITIDPSGNLYPCHLMISQEQFSLGNLNSVDFQDAMCKYTSGGGGKVLQERLLNKYNCCPSYSASNQGTYQDRLSAVTCCPLHLELIES